MLKTCQSHSIHTAIFAGDHRQMERVSAPIADLAVVPAPVATADTPAPGPVPVHCVVCDIAALLHPSFSRNRCLPRTVVLDRSHRVCSQPQNNQDHAWNHRWYSVLMAIGASSAQVSCAITGKTQQKSCRVATCRAYGRSSGTRTTDAQEDTMKHSSSQLRQPVRREEITKPKKNSDLVGSAQRISYGETSMVGHTPRGVQRHGIVRLCQHKPERAPRLSWRAREHCVPGHSAGEARFGVAQQRESFYIFSHFCRSGGIGRRA